MPEQSYSPENGIRQIGGEQEVFLQLAGHHASVDEAIKAVRALGGRPLHVYPPKFLVVTMPQRAVSQLQAGGPIKSVHTGPIDLTSANHELRLAGEAWNTHIEPQRRVQEMANPHQGKRWDEPGYQPPGPPHIREQFREQEQEFRRIQGLIGPVLEGAPNFSVPVLVGKVAVGLVWVDSTVSDYQITDQEKTKTLNETTSGLNWLAGLEPSAGVTWVYDFKRPKISLTSSSFTNQNQNDWENLWRNAALGAMGYSADLNGMNNYINQIKSQNGAAWAYAVFITKYPKTWFAYTWGNHVVMDFGVDGWGIDNFHIVIAHETGHIFGCPDEYTSSGCNCASLFGRYQIPNGNCESCAAHFVPCLMSHNTQAVCDYTRGHVGWNEAAVLTQNEDVLKGTWTFDLDSGVEGPATGADIWWEQVDNTTRFLVPIGGATISQLGKPNFDAVSRETLRAAAFSSNPINGSNNGANQLTPGSVIAVRTGAGHYSKVKINSYGYNLDINWVTYAS
jgi:hypothetical protein